MNSLLNLGRCLGDVSSPAFQRYYLYQSVQSLEHCSNITFAHTARDGQPDQSGQKKVSDDLPVAHTSGTNCLQIDSQTSQFLFTGGADSTVRMWDLDQHAPEQTQSSGFKYSPSATLSRAHPLSHTHALTSISVYPFDASPLTLLSTSYDKSLLLSAITPSSLQPIHKSDLDFIPHTHAISPHPSSSPLVAIGTTHPAVRLFDLRTGLSTHSLPGHNGAVYALAFHTSVQHPHILFSGAVDGRILLFDIRRANPAFASLDLNDAVGFPTSPFSEPGDARAQELQLNFKAQAHTGPVTGLTLDKSGRHLVSAGHDGRIRIWDLATGRNDLVHFGPRIRNSRNGNLAPVVLPSTCGKPDREMIAWPNDDGRGEIFLLNMKEGNLMQVLRTKGVDRSNIQKMNSSTHKMTNKGRISQIVLRYGGDTAVRSEGIELYSAHGDGSICAWQPHQSGSQDAEIAASDEHDSKDEEDVSPAKLVGSSEDVATDQSSRKRKRDLIGDLVQGLTKRQVTFS